MALAEGERRVNGLQRHLELGQDEIAGLEIVAGALDVLRNQVAIRTLDNENAIVARFVVNQDGGRAGRLAGDALDMPRPDVDLLEILQHALAQRIVATFDTMTSSAPSLAAEPSRRSAPLPP